MDGRLHEAHSALSVLVDVFAGDDGVVDDDTEGNDEGEHGDHVDGHVQPGYEQEGPHEGDGYAHSHPERQLELEEQPQDPQDQDQSQEAIAHQQGQALLVDLGPIVVDGVVHPGRQVWLNPGHGSVHGLGDARGCLVADAVHGQADATMVAVGGQPVRLLEGLAHHTHVAEGYGGAAGRGDDGYRLELAGPVAPFIHAHQYFARLGANAPPGYLDGAGPDAPDNLVQGEAVRPQAGLGNLGPDLIVAPSPHIDLGDIRILEQAIAHLLHHLPQGPLRRFAVQLYGQYLSAPGHQRDLRVLRISREGPDAGDLLLNVLVHFLLICPLHQFHRHHAHAFGRGGLDLLDAIQTADRLFHHQHDALLHLGRAGARVRHSHSDHAQVELGEDFLLDLE